MVSEFLIVHNYLNVLQLAIKASHNHTIGMPSAAKLHPAVVLLLVHILLTGNLDPAGHIPLVFLNPFGDNGQAVVILCRLLECY